MKTKEMLLLDQNLLRNHLYSTFLLLPLIGQNDIIHDTEVEVNHGIIITTKITNHKTDFVLDLEIDLVMIRILLPHNTHDHEMTIKREIRDHIARLTDPHTDPIIDVTLVADIDHARIQEITTILQDTHLTLDHLHDQETLGWSLSNTKNKPNTIHPQTQNDPNNFEDGCITQLK